MTFATLCDQCEQRVDVDDEWRVKLEVRPSTSWFKRALVPGAAFPERKDLHFCSVHCLADWATQYDGERTASNPPTSATNAQSDGERP